MKKVLGIVVALLLAVALLPACGGGGGGDGGNGGGGGTPPGYTGFLTPASGQWAEYVSSGDGEEYHQRMEWIGEDTVGGKTCTGFEMTMRDTEEGEIIVQMWLDAANQQPVKYVMKMGGEVYCMEVSQSTYEPPESGTQYNPDLPDIEYGTYTTPTGKPVNVAKFTIGGGETWVSSEVPFGIVKVIVSGTEQMELYDFGLIGAERSITKAEMDSCTSFPSF